MFLRAGALSLALLLASRVLGLARESALAAAFGTTGLGDLAVLALTLPDWIASVLAGGALAYVLLPAWAGQAPGQVAVLQRRVAGWLLAGGAGLGVLLLLLRDPVARWLAAGVPEAALPLAGQALVWSALALPAALLATLWVTRLQHERDFAGMYGANLVANAALVAAIMAAGLSGSQAGAVAALGLGLLLAMALRLLWLRWRQPAAALQAAAPVPTALPTRPLWLWAMLAAGLPLALPFAARSIASQAGEGALATFNYAWKLVELPLLLAIQLVASLAFPAIAQAFAGEARGTRDDAPLRRGFALAWTLACAAVAGLVLGGAALARLLFGWGRMQPAALDQVAHWGIAGSWGLLPQAIAAVALTVLAAQRRLRAAVAAYAIALLLLLGLAGAGVTDGFVLMQALNAGYALVALVCVVAIGREARAAIPWRAFAWSGAALAAAVLVGRWLSVGTAPLAAQLAAAALAAMAIVLLTLGRSAELRQALHR